MGKQTMVGKLKRWARWQEMKFMNILLKRSGYDFGVYFAEELGKMYQENKHKINRT